MHDKRGQITFFVITGVLILAAIAIFLYIQSVSTSDQEKEVPAEVAPVKYFVEKCLEKIGDQAVRENSLKGGYYSLGGAIEPLSLLSPSYVVPVYFYYTDNENIILYPQQEIVENELTNYVSDNLPSCINNFEDMKGYTIKADNFSIKAKMGMKSVIVEAYYPMDVNTYSFSDFSAEIPLRMGEMYYITRNLTEEQLTAETGICLTCYAIAAIKNNVKFDYIVNGDFYIVAMRDMTEEKPFYFMYSIKPRRLETAMAVSDKLEIKEIKSQLAKVGSEFAYQVELTDDSIKNGVVFSDETDLFEIGQDGKISFVPTEAQKGAHSVKINAKADKISAFYIFTLIIE